jgi:translocation and assembly module TamB
MVRFMLLGSASIIVLVLIGYALLRIPYIQHRIKTLAVGTLERQFGARLELGRISGNLLSGLTIDEIRLGSSTGVILSANRLSIRYRLPMLLKRTLAITRLRIEGLRLNLVRSPEGNWNIVDAFAPETPAAEGPPPEIPFHILLESLLVVDGTVVVNDSSAQPHRIQQFEDIVFDIGFELDKLANVNVRKLSFKLDQPRLMLTGMKGNFTYNMLTGQAGADGIDIATELSRLSLNAQYAPKTPEPEISLDLNFGALSLSELGRLLSVSALNRGIVSGDIILKGTPDRFKHRLKLGLDGQILTAEGVVSGGNTGNIGLESSGTIRNLNPAAWPLDGLNDWAGDINADFEIVGRALERPERQGRLTVLLKSSGLAGYRIDSGAVEMVADNGTVVVPEAHLVGPSGDVRLNGRLVGLKEPGTVLKAAVKGEIRRLDTDALLPGSNLGGMLNIDLNAEAVGRLDTAAGFDPATWTAATGLRLLPSSLMATAVTSGKVLADWDGKTLQLTTLEVQSELGQAALMGRATLQPLSYRVGGTILVGKLKQTAQLLEGLLPRIPIESLPEGQLKIDGAWNGNTVQVKALNLRTDAVEAMLKGQVTVEPLAYQVEGDIAVAEAKKIVPLLSDVIPQLAADQLPSGHFRISGAADGDGQQVDLRANLEVDGLTHPDLTIASARLDGNLQIVGDHITGWTEGSLLDIRYADTLFPKLDLTVKLDPETAVLDLSLQKDTGEHLQLAGQVAPWRQDDRRIRIDSLKVTGIVAPFDRFIPEFGNSKPIHLRIHPEGVDVDTFKLVSGKILLSAAGKLALRGSQQFRLSLTGLDLEVLETIWQEEPTLKGLLAADVELSGTSESPDIDIQMTVSGASGYEVSLSDVNCRLRYRDGKATLQVDGFRKDHRMFTAEGRSELKLRLMPFEFTPQPGSLQAQLVAEDLKLSELPNPQHRNVRLEGRTTIRLEAAGDVFQPTLTGSITLREGSLAMPRHGLTYESVQADLHMLPGKLTVDRLLLSGDREGSLSLKGDILFDGWSPSSLSLHLSGQNAPVAWRREVTARIDPDISLTGPLSSPVLAGRLRIPQGRINLDRMMTGGPADIQVLGEPSADGQPIVISGPQDDFLSSLTADLTIEVPRNVWLRGQELNAEISGQIKLVKKPQGPFVLIGTLQTVRGSYLFQDRRFDITRGLVEFQGLENPDPALDIRAETRIRDVTIIVRITGSARMIELALESEPMLDQADIISYLVFGRPTNELRSDQATSAQVAALNFAGRAAARELNAILGNTLRVDEIRIDPGEEDWRSGSLTLGKYVARNIFMTYRMGFRTSSFGSVRIEYEINRNFSVEAVISDDQSSGVDLIWSKDF